jgi:hypothetical protein
MAEDPRQIRKRGRLLEGPPQRAAGTDLAVTRLPGPPRTGDTPMTVRVIVDEASTDEEEADWLTSWLQQSCGYTPTMIRHTREPA